MRAALALAEQELAAEARVSAQRGDEHVRIEVGLGGAPPPPPPPGMMPLDEADEEEMSVGIELRGAGRPPPPPMPPPRSPGPAGQHYEF